MKKIFTLLSAASVFTTVTAQYGPKNNQNGYAKSPAVNNGHYEKEPRDNNSKR